MFHWQDGIYFGRKEDGSVRIIKMPGVSSKWPKADGDYPDAEIDLTIPDNSWGSIVASVSHGGEGDGRWYQAMEFHNGKAPQ